MKFLTGLSLMTALLLTSSNVFADKGECKISVSKYSSGMEGEMVEKLLIKRGYTIVDEAEADLFYSGEGFIHGEWGYIVQEISFKIEGELYGKTVLMEDSYSRSVDNIPGIIWDYFKFKRKVKRCSYLLK